MSLLVMRLLMKMLLLTPPPHHCASDVWEYLPKSEEPKCSTGLFLTLLARLAVSPTTLSQTFRIILRVWWWAHFIMQWDVLCWPMLPLVCSHRCVQLLGAMWRLDKHLWLCSFTDSSFHLSHLLEYPVDSRSQQQTQVPLMIQFSYVTHKEA